MTGNASEIASQLRHGSTAVAAAGGFAIATLLILGLLHALSPEFAPSWRMVSEYANGRHGWALSLMFLSWAISSWLFAYALYRLAETRLARLGIGFLVIAGIGEAMAAAFDINHPLHMHAAILGIGGLPIAAMLVGVTFARAGHWGQSRPVMLWFSNLTWISVLLMSVAMGVFFASLAEAGVEMGPDAKPLAALPSGVVAFGGWANRFLILSYCAWTIAGVWCLRQPTAVRPVPA